MHLVKYKSWQYLPARTIQPFVSICLVLTWNPVLLSTCYHNKRTTGIPTTYCSTEINPEAKNSIKKINNSSLTKSSVKSSVGLMGRCPCAQSSNCKPYLYYFVYQVGYIAGVNDGVRSISTLYLLWSTALIQSLHALQSRESVC